MAPPAKPNLSSELTASASARWRALKSTALDTLAR